jgi:hypothetical protein
MIEANEPKRLIDVMRHNSFYYFAFTYRFLFGEGRAGRNLRVRATRES